jgi:hypothetical protein
MTAWHHNQLAAEIIAIQTVLGANLLNVPAAATQLPRAIVTTYVYSIT